jgi:hypothetical protein
MTSKAIREHPGFALRAASEAIQRRSHNLPSMSSCEYCCGIVSTAAMRAAVTATGKRNPALQGGGRHVHKYTICDGLRAGVAEDDLSEKALGAVRFDGLEVTHAIFNPSKTTTGVCVPEGQRGQGRAKAMRNGINRGDPLAGSRRFMPDSLYPCTESKPARRQPGEHCPGGQCGGVSHARDFQPLQRASSRECDPPRGISFAASLESLVRWSGRSADPPGPRTQLPSILPSSRFFNRICDSSEARKKCCSIPNINLLSDRRSSSNMRLLTGKYFEGHVHECGGSLPENIVAAVPLGHCGDSCLLLSIPLSTLLE